MSMLNHFQHDGTLGGRAQGQTETSTTLEGVPVRGATGGIEDPDMMVTTIPGNATPTTAMTEPSVGEHEELHSGKQQPLPNINEHPLVMPDPLLNVRDDTDDPPTQSDANLTHLERSSATNSPDPLEEADIPTSRTEEVDANPPMGDSGQNGCHSLTTPPSYARGTEGDVPEATPAITETEGGRTGTDATALGGGIPPPPPLPTPRRTPCVYRRGGSA